MPLATRINDLATAIGQQIKAMAPRLLPAGGAAGQVLTKTTADDYAAGWATPAAGGGGVAQEDFDLLAGEIAEARGDRSTLNLRISTISNFASPNAGGNIVGQFVDNAFHGGNATTLTGVANRAVMAPFYTSHPLRIDQFGVAVSSGVAGAQGRLFMYEAGPDGWPDALIFEGPANLDFATSGYRYHPIDFTFDAGRQYWLGLLSSSTAAVRAIATTSAVNLGLGTSTGTTYATVLQRTMAAFANPLPANWGFVTSDRGLATAPPSIRMRVAELASL